jgi:hypothetical protein
MAQHTGTYLPILATHAGHNADLKQLPDNK